MLGDPNLLCGRKELSNLALQISVAKKFESEMITGGMRATPFASRKDCPVDSFRIGSPGSDDVIVTQAMMQVAIPRLQKECEDNLKLILNYIRSYGAVSLGNLPMTRVEEWWPALEEALFCTPIVIEKAGKYNAIEVVCDIGNGVKRKLYAGTVSFKVEVNGQWVDSQSIASKLCDVLLLQPNEEEAIKVARDDVEHHASETMVALYTLLTLTTRGTGRQSEYNRLQTGITNLGSTEESACQLVPMADAGVTDRLAIGPESIKYSGSAKRTLNLQWLDEETGRLLALYLAVVKTMKVCSGCRIISL
jgi:hypothetical protein